MHSSVAIRKISANRQQRHIRPQPPPNLLETIKVSRIPRVIHLYSATRYTVATIPAVRILEHPRPPVPARSHRYPQPSHHALLPPLHAMHLCESQPLHQVLHPPWHHNLRSAPSQSSRT